MKGKGTILPVKNYEIKLHQPVIRAQTLEQAYAVVAANPQHYIHILLSPEDGEKTPTTSDSTAASLIRIAQALETMTKSLQIMRLEKCLPGAFSTDNAPVELLSENTGEEE